MKHSIADVSYVCSPEHSLMAFITMSNAKACYSCPCPIRIKYSSKILNNIGSALYYLSQFFTWIFYCKQLDLHTILIYFMLPIFHSFSYSSLFLEYLFLLFSTYKNPVRYKTTIHVPLFFFFSAQGNLSPNIELLIHKMFAYPTFL